MNKAKKPSTKSAEQEEIRKLKANIGYKRRYFKSSVPALIADNHLQQQLVVS